MKIEGSSLESRRGLLKKLNLESPTAISDDDVRSIKARKMNGRRISWRISRNEKREESAVKLLCLGNKKSKVGPAHCGPTADCGPALHSS